jgi:hypothetical protein
MDKLVDGRPLSGVVDDGRVEGAVMICEVEAGIKKELDPGEVGCEGYPSVDGR